MYNSMKVFDMEDAVSMTTEDTEKRVCGMLLPPVHFRQKSLSSRLE